MFLIVAGSAVDICFFSIPNNAFAFQGVHGVGVWKAGLSAIPWE